MKLTDRLQHQKRDFPTTQFLVMLGVQCMINKSYRMGQEI